MVQKFSIGTQHLFLNFVVIPLEKVVYGALLRRGWLIAAKVNHNWKRNTPCIKSEGRKYVVDLKNQAICEELASFDLGSDDSNDYEWGFEDRKRRMEPNDEGLSELVGCSEDETSSLNGLFHWQMEYHEVFHPNCNMLLL